MGKMDLWFNWALGIAIALAFLYLTPLGGIVNLWVGGSAVLGGGYLLLTVVLRLFEFDSFSDSEHWKDIGLRAAGALSLLLFAIVLSQVLPRPDLTPDSSCVVGRGQIEPC